MSGGGITPARSLRMTFSHFSACSAALVRSSPCSDRLAVLTRSLWQVTQYRSRSARGFSLEADDDVKPGVPAASARVVTGRAEVVACNPERPACPLAGLTHSATDMPMAQPRTETHTDRAVTVPSRVGARELEASVAAWPRERGMKDRAGSKRHGSYACEEYRSNWFGNQIKRRRPERTHWSGGPQRFSDRSPHSGKPHTRRELN